MKKNAWYILVAYAVIAAVCYYLYKVMTAYEGALVNNLSTFVFAIPVILSVNLWRILTGKQAHQKQELWQKVLTVVLFLMGVATAIYLLVSSQFYSLAGIILIVFLIAAIPCLCVEYWRGEKPSKQPILAWTAGIIATYLLVFGTVATYIHVVQPVTVAKATDMVTEEYGEDCYEFVGYLDFHRDTSPIGVYWFQNVRTRDYLEVDLITGDMHTIA